MSYQLIYDLQTNFEKFDVKKEEALQIIKTELLIYGGKTADHQVPIEEVWALLVGYNEPVLDKYTDKSIVMNLRMLLAEFSNEGIWMDNLASYFQIEKKYRLFHEENGEIIQIIPQILTYRTNTYAKLLFDVLDAEARDCKFAEAGDFSYSRTVETMLQTYSGSIPKIEITYPMLPKYREKVKCSSDLNTDWVNIAVEMEKKSQKSYIERANRIQFQSLHVCQQNTFEYHETQHIAGGLAAGKSTWMMLETYRQVKDKGAKVGFIENSVFQVLDRVKELRDLGIKAVPIIGKGSRADHEKRFLESYADSSKDLSQFLTQTFHPLVSISDSCTLKALAHDFERNNYYPCKSVKQNGKTVLCPLANTCGVYKEWTELVDADVWVATTASLINSSIPAVIDPFERTIYEAMYDLLDIIFVDEADAVQKQLDEQFTVEVDAFGNNNSFFEKSLYEMNKNITGRYTEFANDKLIRRWQINSRELDKAVWALYAKLSYTPKIQNYLQNKLLFPSKLAYELSKKITKDEEAQRKIEKQLRKFAVDPSKTVRIKRKLEQLLAGEPNKDQILQEVVSFFKIDDQITGDTVDLLEFYLYFSYLDYNIKFLLSYYPAVQSRLGIGYDVSPLLTKAKQYKPFLLEAMTGKLFGYRYEQTEDDKLGNFKILEYSGIGRKLLYDWSNVYEIAFKKKGPAVVLLSGTSLAPGSDHYDIEMKPKWLIQSELPPSEIKQLYLPAFDEKDGDLLCISGRHEQQRAENLSKLTASLEDRLLVELKVLQVEKRRILLVVNSYEDARTVANTLEMIPSLSKQYRVLTRENDKLNNAFPRSRIEMFRKEEQKILIVPLMSVGRGFNILDGSAGALFGSVFFLVRPYPVPNDFNYMIQVLHAAFPVFMNHIESRGLNYGKAIKKLRSLSMGRFESMYKRADFWAVLTPKEREVLSWFIFIPVWQMIGRLLRGGKNARVYYCDGSFHNKNSNVPSLLEFWRMKMQKYKDDETFMALYGPFVTSIENMWKVED
ncbi:hypothetical protein [Bacillus cytotoxicus]|uniref:pPIWI_RE_Z domain-containing protein n=1 Tax=Bacillus cytotoxicus TaxID=580165 RepID=UPI00244ADF0F|nr:hypothetical protein [Bacillus cytotoxicus]MDH2879772.1 hypothetical protein [Bacillus cytotoxicus]